MAPVHTYHCLDGRDFPVEFANDADARATWFWDPEHNPEPLTPMDQSVWTGAARGAGRARAECGFDPGDVFIGGAGHSYFNGFYYARPVLPSRAARAAAAAANRRLAEEYGSAAKFWERRGEPRAVAAFDQLKTGGPELDASGLIELFAYGFEQTFLMFGLMDRELQRLLAAEYGQDGERLAAVLLAGRENATLDADQALWDLAEVARRNPLVRDALLKGAPRATVETVDGARGFLAGLDGYLDRFGWRTTGWHVSSPSLREQPDLVMTMIRRLVAESVPAPSDASARSAEERERLAAEVGTRFGAGTARSAAVQQALADSAGYLAIKEGRALWQLNLTGALRYCFLVRGTDLAGSGVLGDPDDVFYLRPEEMDRMVAAIPDPTALRSLVAERRAERDRWRGATPPARVGGEPTRRDGISSSGPGGRAGEPSLSGVPASPGEATGTACVLRTLDDIERLEAGDILVCSTTTPAWTAVFGLAAAVIADGGDMSSHTAIAAREYGIPAVTGAHGATSLISDGQTVTVDGMQGLVTLG